MSQMMRERMCFPQFARPSGASSVLPPAPRVGAPSSARQIERTPPQSSRVAAQNLALQVFEELVLHHEHAFTRSRVRSEYQPTTRR